MSANVPQFRAGLHLRPIDLNASLEHNGYALKGIWKSCIACDHFNEGLEQCQLAKARPPARVIAFGCTAFSDDMDIPF